MVVLEEIFLSSMIVSILRSELSVADKRSVAHEDEVFHENQLCSCGRLLTLNRPHSYISCWGRRLMWDCMINWRTVTRKKRGKIAHVIMERCECDGGGWLLAFFDEIGHLLKTGL